MKIRHIATAVIVASMMAMWGCTTIEPQPEDATLDERPAGAEAGASSSGVQLDSGAGGSAMSTTPMTATADSLNDPNSPLSKRIFYFAYDSSSLDELDRDILAEHGRYLASHPAQKLVIEGHTDERGTREYNLALGERRAAAVEQIISLQGASRAQVQVVSLGEERPAMSGHDDESWGQNRRAELIYAGR